MIKRLLFQHILHGLRLGVMTPSSRIIVILIFPLGASYAALESEEELFQLRVGRNKNTFWRKIISLLFKDNNPQYSEVTSGSTLRNHSWQPRRPYGMLKIESRSASCKAETPYPLCYCSGSRKMISEKVFGQIKGHFPGIKCPMVSAFLFEFLHVLFCLTKWKLGLEFKCFLFRRVRLFL